MARRSAQSPAKTTVGCKPARVSGNVIVNKTESQQIVIIGQLLKKLKKDEKEEQQFHATIEGDQKALRELLARRRRQAKTVQRRRHNELTSTILNALRAPNQGVQGATRTFTGTVIGSNPVHGLTSGVLNASKGLINEYHRLDGIISKLRTEEPHPIADTWKQDLDKTDKQLRLGARVALRNVKKALGADVEGDTNGEMDVNRDTTMGTDDKMELSYELQKSLMYAERGIKRMVKGLPLDEGR